MRVRLHPASRRARALAALVLAMAALSAAIDLVDRDPPDPLRFLFGLVGAGIVNLALLSRLRRVRDDLVPPPGHLRRSSGALHPGDVLGLAVVAAMPLLLDGVSALLAAIWVAIAAQQTIRANALRRAERERGVRFVDAVGMLRTRPHVVQVP